MAVLGRNLLALNTYVKKEEGFQIDNPTLQHKEQEKEEQNKPKAIRRQEVQVRVKINEIENGKIIEQNNETKSRFFEDQEN